MAFNGAAPAPPLTLASPSARGGAVPSPPQQRNETADLLDLLGFAQLEGDRRETQAAPPSTGADQWATRQVVLIRHGRSTWNEFLGQHKKREWAEDEQARSSSSSSTSLGNTVRDTTRGFRGALSKMVTGTSSKGPSPPFGGGYGGSGIVGETPDVSGVVDAADKRPSNRSVLMQAVRGGVKHVANALQNADKLHQVDHALSNGGIAQARALRRRVAAVAQGDGAGGAAQNGAGVLLRCRQWYISPYLRALQTAGFALGPLLRRDPQLRLLVCPEACEIVKSQMAWDCQGKVGNVGHRIVARAISRTAECFEEDEDDPENSAVVTERQAELADITATLCAMDLREVGRVWWKDVSSFKREHLKLEDAKIRRLVSLMLRQKGSDPIGVVAHSILFQRMIQLFLPKDPSVQEAVRNALRNGAPAADTRDPLYDKIMNCGTLVLTWRYREALLGLECPESAAQIVSAEFLFEGHMEGALGGDLQSLDVSDVVPEASSSIDVADPLTGVGNYQGASGRSEVGLL